VAITELSFSANVKEHKSNENKVRIWMEIHTLEDLKHRLEFSIDAMQKLLHYVKSLRCSQKLRMEYEVCTLTL